MKDLQPDTVTKKAVTIKRSLQDVLNNPKSTAKDRVLVRIIYHKLIQERVSRFKDMVTKDLLMTGTKKHRRLRKSKFEAEAEARLKEEEDYHVTLEQMMTLDKIKGAESDKDDGSEDDSDEDLQVTFGKIRTLDERKQGDEREHDYDEDAQLTWEKMKIKEKMHRDRENSDDDSAESENGDGAIKQSFRERNTEKLEPVAEDSIVSDIPQSRKTGKRKLDSMFLGSLSSMQDDDITQMLQTTKKESQKQKVKAKRLQKQQPNVRAAQESSRSPPETKKQKVPMVDQPNPVRQTTAEKLIPGINCHPDLPPRHTRRDVLEKKSHKLFPSRLQSKQMLASQSRQKALQRPAQARYPTAATVSSQKGAPAQETLHPSWEASKKRKEESKIVPFQGKKITFDED
ncbi:serum response factor-binding protein 1-like isoform X2 [Acanthaster planci]|nr:serum response factor-binding protein 1-like isoform X2 [Acanthaster planci]